jgi:hypothetical protein
MGAHKPEGSDPVVDQGETINQVRLLGRLAADPQLRELPSGDTVWSLRVVVDRPVVQGAVRPRQRVDSLECAVWSGRLKSRVGAGQRATWSRCPARSGGASSGPPEPPRRGSRWS